MGLVGETRRGAALGVPNPWGSDQLYDEAYGPISPRARVRRRRATEWDDPTWVCVEVDELWMVEETRRSHVSPVAKLECCKQWDALDTKKRHRWEYQCLHQLSHNRTPFTVDRFADLARISRYAAQTMLHDAWREKWLHRGDDTRLWVGRLGGKR